MAWVDGWPQGLRHSPDLVADAQWAGDAVRRGTGRVAGVIPPVFEAYGRLLRPAGELRWADVAARAGVVLTSKTRWNDLGSRTGERPAPQPLDGYLPPGDAAVLAEVLRGFTASPTGCVFLVWTGYPPALHMKGDVYLHQSGHVVLTGDVATGAVLHEQSSATAWWPRDRAWFVYSDLDGYDSYVGGSAAAITALQHDDRIEVLGIHSDDPVDTSPWAPYDPLEF
jgi:hypothetical protein